MLEILARAGCYIAVIILGYTLRQRGFFGPEAFGVLSKLVVKITLPAALIASTAGKSIDPKLLSLSLIGFGGGVAYMLLAALVNRKADREKRAFAILNTPGYNIGTFALPFTSSFMGPVGVITTSLFDVGNSFVCLGGAYGIATTVKEGKGFSVKRVLKALATSIPFLTQILLVTMNLNGWKFPATVITLAKIIGDANAFLAMLTIGVGFKLTGDRSQLGSIVQILSLRYGLAAVLAIACWFWLPFDLEIRRTLVILLFAPIGSAVPLYTAELKSDVGLSSAINSIAIVISIVIIVTLLVVML